MPDERPNIQRLHAYVPGEQPGYRETLGGGAFGEGIVKLNTNENPYPPSPRALAALRSIGGESLRRYPDAFADEFRRAVSAELDVPPDWILVTNGGAALIAVGATCFWELLR